VSPFVWDTSQVFQGPAFSNLRDHSGLSVQGGNVDKQIDPIWQVMRRVIYRQNKAKRLQLRLLATELERARAIEVFKANYDHHEELRT